MTSAPGAGPGRDALIAALQDRFIDPDLGVNVVDLGFIRRAGIEDGTASLVMTLTSPACPLTKVIEDQARTAVVGTLAARAEDRMDLEPRLGAGGHHSRGTRATQRDRFLVRQYG